MGWLGSNVLSSRSYDQVLLSTHDSMEAVVVDRHQVARPQPTILSHVLPRSVLPVGVAHHDVSAPHQELLLLCHLPIVGSHKLAFVALCKWRPHRTHLELVDCVE